jgi:hypothetical protein
MEYIDGDDMQEFQKLFPSAYRWLLRRSLKRELDHLNLKLMQSASLKLMQSARSKAQRKYSVYPSKN